MQNGNTTAFARDLLLGVHLAGAFGMRSKPTSGRFLAPRQLCTSDTIQGRNLVENGARELGRHRIRRGNNI